MRQIEYLFSVLVARFSIKVAGFRQRPLHEKIYATSFSVVIVLLIANVVFPGARPVIMTLYVIAAHGFIAGFVAWLWPILKARWDTSLGLVAKTVLHVIAFLIANVGARYQVSKALGLPAQDFDLTVNFIVLLMYLPAWGLILAVLLTPTFIVGFPMMLWALCANKEQHERRVATGVAHLMGAMGVAIYAAQLFQYAAESTAAVRSVVRVVAAFADYQPAVSYPGIKPGDRIRLHENGIVSSAKLTPTGVVLCVWDRATPEQVACSPDD
jgi:hypothetical protein